jgi:hypothetical protein
VPAASAAAAALLAGLAALLPERDVLARFMFGSLVPMVSV